MDGRARAMNHRVAEGVTVTVAPEEAATDSPEAPPDIDVAIEDEHLLVVDKPAGLVTHPAPGHDGPTLSEALGGFVVHRLDRDTSGLLLVAKTCSRRCRPS